MKRRSTNALLGMLAFVILSLAGCHGGGGGEEAPDSPEGAASGEISITAGQFESSGMQLGIPEQRLFRQKVMANGYILASPEGMAQVSSLLPGRVNRIGLSVGDYVKKGETLFTLEGNEIFMIQQEYAEAINELTALKSNYDRQKVLAEEQITSQKDLINTESSYRTLLARADGLKLRLRMINIDPSNVEQGRIAPVATITSPISGYISRMEIVLGQFIEPGEMVMEIIDPDRFQLNLHLFEKDLVNLAAGQKVIFHDPDKRDRVFEATLSKIGRAIDPETKTVLCIASLKAGDRESFVNGLYVQSEIITCERYAPAVPSEALIRENGRHFILSGSKDESGNYLLHKLPVIVGVITEEYAEVLDTTLQNILLKGAYNLSGVN